MHHHSKVEHLRQAILTAIRQISRPPRTGIRKVRTSGIVARSCRALWGQVHEGIGGTGVVGLIKGQGWANRRVVCVRPWMRCRSRKRRGVAYASTTRGGWHACGPRRSHDDLLGARANLAETTRL